MPSEVTISLPPNFSFRHTVGSHGWYDLPPFEYSPSRPEMTYVFMPAAGRPPVSVSVKLVRRRLVVTYSADPAENGRVAKGIRHILRLDEPLDEFYRLISSDPQLGWASTAGAGRLLRSENVWEDLVKTICTTNCSWALTKKMVSNLVQKLGEPAADGRKAFPTPRAMADVEADFYRNEIRAGYRSPYLAELAQAVSSGQLDPETWLTSELPTAELRKQLKKVKGVGDYAADNLLKLLGRYDGGLALDSWVRSQFYKKHNRGKACEDKKVIRFYEKFGRWRALAVWCDITEHWFNQDVSRSA